MAAQGKPAKGGHVKKHRSLLVMAVGFVLAGGVGGAATASPAPVSATASPAPVSAPSAVHAALPVASPVVANSEVRAEYKTSDGVTHVTLYETGFGVTAADLYSRLKAQGVRGLQDPSVARSSSAGGLQPNGVGPGGNPCGYNNATTLECYPVTWARNGNLNPQIYYWDHTGSRWPVGSAISTWNQSPNIHVVWSPGGCSSDRSTHCIDVSEGHDGYPNYWGLTGYNYDSNRNLLDGTVWIRGSMTMSTTMTAVLLVKSSATHSEWDTTTVRLAACTKQLPRRTQPAMITL